MKYCIFCMKETNGNICSHCGKRQDEYIAQPHVLTPGTILKDKYQIGAVLGDGGFGITYEASGISVGGDPPFALTSELFLDSEPEAKTSHRASGLPLTGSERNATMADRR